MKTIAILIEDMFDENELIYPYYRLLEEGFEVHLVGPEKDKAFKSKSGVEKQSTHSSKEISAEDYDGLVIPGGFSPDYMRRTKETVEFVKEMNRAGKPIAAICHGPWMLASADALRGKKVTSFPSLKADLENAGGEYLDEEVVVDGNLITSRNPGDLPAFMKATIEKLK